MPSRIPLPAAIVESRTIAVLRATRPEYMVPVALELHELGIRCLEVTLSTPGAFAAIEELRRRLGDEAAVGAGTVLTEDDVRRSADAGAGYLLSPVTDPLVMRAAEECGLPFVPGAGTATEIATAWKLGAAAVKVFPANALGGPSFIRSIVDPLPQLALIPTGGVTAAELSAYFRAGALAVGVGTPLTGDALRGGPVDELRARVQQFLAALREETVTA